jgi:hypothetical protein
MSISYKQNDKFLAQIVEELKLSPTYKFVKSLPNSRSLYIHGISSAKDLDVIISSNIPKSNELTNIFRTKGLSTERGILINNAHLYNNITLGLGLNLRKNDKEKAKKIILLVYLALNDRLTFS